MSLESCSRRKLLKAAFAVGLVPGLAFSETETMLRRSIPGTDESLPVIGLGTYEVFDVAGSPDEIAARKEIIDMLIDRGGSVVDSSPMYNRSERIVGDILESSGNRDKVFLATKVWTNGKSSGEAQMQRSADLLHADVIDLMQVHNLRDTAVHMATISDWRQQGRIRYSGITHYAAGAHRSLERAMRDYRPDFIQINYSLGEQQAAQRVLPLAKELGIAVLVNRPFMAGRLFSRVRGTELPDWSQPFAQSWGQFFLKFIVSHSAVTCAIPATSKPHHMIDNLGAGFGELPDAATRERMAEFWESL